MTYGNIHRFFLRSIMSKGVMQQSEAVEVLRKHSEWSEHNLKDVVDLINSKIRPLQQEVKIITAETSAAVEIVFISTGEGESAKAASPHPAPELDYFRRVVEAIATSDDKSITGIAALNLTSQVELRAVTKQRGQELLDIWCKAHYLNKSESLAYILGTRGMLEFEHYIKENLPDTLDDCYLCKKTVFQAITCDKCGESFHSVCLNKFLERVDKWPCCKAQYNPASAVTIQECSQSDNYSLSLDFDDVLQAMDSEDASISNNSQDQASRKRKRDDR